MRCLDSQFLQKKDLKQVFSRHDIFLVSVKVDNGCNRFYSCYILSREDNVKERLAKNF